MTLYDTCKRITEQWQAEKYDGVLVDATSANLYVQVYEGLNETNRERLAGMDTVKAMKVCWKLVK